MGTQWPQWTSEPTEEGDINLEISPFGTHSLKEQKAALFREKAILLQSKASPNFPRVKHKLISAIVNKLIDIEERQQKVRHDRAMRSSIKGYVATYG